MIKPLEIPEGFIAPNIEKNDYRARKLSAKDVYLDYLAVMSSLKIIKKTRGGRWPTKDLSFEDDLIDLCWHQREFENQTSFAYTVMNNDETKCLGCFYLYPIGFRTSLNSENKEYNVDVSWWVIPEMYAAGFYKTLFNDVQLFLKEK